MYRADDQSPILVTAFDGFVFGLDRRTGEIRWKVRVLSPDQPRYLGGIVEIAIHGNRVFAAGEHTNELVCIGYPNGEEIGRAKISVPGAERPTFLIEGDQLFVGRKGHVECFTLDGQPVWQQLFDDVGGQSVALGFPGNVRPADDRNLG